MCPQPLICVRDVEASSRWYQRLLGCRSGHGGTQYEQLVANGQLLMQLHAWEVGHHHGPIGNPDLAHGNGVLLWFEVEDFEAAVVRAQELRAEVVLPRHWEIWLRDLDGYTVVLASPYGTADGTWKPDEGGPFRGR